MSKEPSESVKYDKKVRDNISEDSENLTLLQNLAGIESGTSVSHTKLHETTAPMITKNDKTPAFLYTYLSKPPTLTQPSLSSSNMAVNDNLPKRLDFNSPFIQTTSFSNNVDIKRLSLHIKDVEFLLESFIDQVGSARQKHKDMIKDFNEEKIEISKATNEFGELINPIKDIITSVNSSANAIFPTVQAIHQSLATVEQKSCICQEKVDILAKSWQESQSSDLTWHKKLEEFMLFCTGQLETFRMGINIQHETLKLISEQNTTLMQQHNQILIELRDQGKILKELINQYLQAGDTKREYLDIQLRNGQLEENKMICSNAVTEANLTITGPSGFCEMRDSKMILQGENILAAVKRTDSVNNVPSLKRPISCETPLSPESTPVQTISLGNCHGYVKKRKLILEDILDED